MKESNIDLFKNLQFDKLTGYLVPGIHKITLSDLIQHPILAGSDKRKKLIHNLKNACEIYWSFNITDILINGSFATQEPWPNDIDGLICVDHYNDPRLTKLTESDSIWSNFYFIGPKKKFPMWYEYQIEFFIHPIMTRDRGKLFLEYFQVDRNNIPKGIIKIIKN